MSSTNCLVCTLQFNESINIPKLLECGHSLCSICISKIIKGSKMCPLCNKHITKNQPNHFGTNYLALQLINEIKALQMRPYYEENIVKPKTELTKLLEECITELRDICITLEEIPNQMESVSQVEEHKDKLRRAMAKAKATSERINLWESEFQNTISMADNHTTDPDDTVLSMDKFTSQGDFLEKIWSLLDEDRQVFVMEDIKGVKNYGQVKRCSDFDHKNHNARGIKIHSLSLFEVDRSEATFVRFSELKSCVRMDQLFLFLEGDNEYWGRWCLYYGVMEGPLLLFYTALFTGETGATFKGVKREEGGSRNVLFSVPHYLVDGVPTTGPVGSFSNSEEERDVRRDQEVFGRIHTLAGDWKGTMEDVNVGGRPSSRFFHGILKCSGGYGSFTPWDSIFDCGIILKI